MKKSLRKLTQTITAGLLLSSLLLPSAFAADLPPGTVVSNGLTWTRNNSTIKSKTANWTTANNACNALTAGGYTDWRLPVFSEFDALDNVALKSAGWTLDNTWSSTRYSSGRHYSGYLPNGNTGWGYDDTLYYVSCVR